MRVQNISFENMGTVNKNCVIIETKSGDVELYFSYQTCVAFRAPSGKMYVSENVWSRTTNKLLNELESDKDARYDHESFKKQLAKLFI